MTAQSRGLSIYLRCERVPRRHRAPASARTPRVAHAKPRFSAGSVGGAASASLAREKKRRFFDAAFRDARVEGTASPGCTVYLRPNFLYVTRTCNNGRKHRFV